MDLFIHKATLWTTFCSKAGQWILDIHRFATNLDLWIWIELCSGWIGVGVSLGTTLLLYIHFGPQKRSSSFSGNQEVTFLPLYGILSHSKAFRFIGIEGLKSTDPVVWILIYVNQNGTSLGYQMLHMNII